MIFINTFVSKKTYLFLIPFFAFLLPFISFIHPFSISSSSIIIISPPPPKWTKERVAELKQLPLTVRMSSADGSSDMMKEASFPEEHEHLLVEMLEKLALYQKRAYDQHTMKFSKRIVVGLNETRKLARTGKLRMVLIARNIERVAELGGICDELLRAGTEHHVPTFFCLSKRKVSLTAHLPLCRLRPFSRTHAHRPATHPHAAATNASPCFSELPAGTHSGSACAGSFKRRGFAAAVAAQPQPPTGTHPSLCTTLTSRAHAARQGGGEAIVGVRRRRGQDGRRTRAVRAGGRGVRGTPVHHRSGVCTWRRDAPRERSQIKKFLFPFACPFFAAAVAAVNDERQDACRNACSLLM